MIAFLRGRVAEAYPNQLVLDVNGVGYEVVIPLSTFDRLNPKEGDELTLRTYLQVRETAHTLYGFASAEERDVFRLLIDRVTGIGPAIAISVLSGMAVIDFKTAVVGGDAKELARVKGLGKKTAERIILELKDKVGVTETWQEQASGAASSAVGDAEMALLALGFKQADAKKAVRAAADAGEGTDANELIRAALRKLSVVK